MNAGTDKTPRWADYGSRISTIRSRCGMTQAQLADCIGRSVSEVSRWERGVALPALDVLRRLCRVLCVSLGDLVPRDPQESRPIQPPFNQVDN